MELYRDLSEQDRAYHLEIAKTLQPESWYRFEPYLLLSPDPKNDGGEFIEVRMGQFVRYRGFGVYKDCLFDVWVNKPLVIRRIAVLFYEGIKPIFVKP